jgi:hypothetical protein
MPRRLRIGHARQFRIAADGTAYAFTGQDAALRRAAIVTAAQGSYAVSGQTATLSTSGETPEPTGSPGLFFNYPYLGTITIADGRPNSGPNVYTPDWAAKQQRSTYRTVDGRLYFGGGDDAGSPTSLPEDQIIGSAQGPLYSMHPDDLNALRLEMHYRRFSPTTVWHDTGFDQSGLFWDSTRDLFIKLPLTAFSYWHWVDSVGTLVPLGVSHTPAIPRFISSTSFYVSGDLRAAFTTNRLMQIQITHAQEVPFFINEPAGTAMLHYCRVVSATYDNTGGINRTTVVFSEPPGLNTAPFTQDARRVRVWFDNYNTSVDTGSWILTGGMFFSETAGRCVFPVITFDPNAANPKTYGIEVYTLGAVYNVAVDGTATLGWQMDMTTSDADEAGFNSGQGPSGAGTFVPASLTGRNPEIIMAAGKGGISLWIMDTTTRVLNRYIPSSPSFSATQNAALGYPEAEIHLCTSAGIDTTRNRFYVYASNHGGLLAYVDIAKRRLELMLPGITDPVSGQYLSNRNGGGSVIYNEQLDMVEVWHMGGADGIPVLYLVEPDAPYVVHAVGVDWVDNPNVSRAGLGTPTPDGPFRGAVVHRAGEKSIGLNGQYDDFGQGTDQVGSTAHPTYKSVFIGGNLRWTTVTAAPHYWNKPLSPISGSPPNSGPTLTDAQPLQLISELAGPSFGGGYHEVDSSGNPTGVAYWRTGGDGDYFGNEVGLARFDQLSGTVYGASTNLGTDATLAALWRNRVHSSYVAGGTAGQPEIYANPSDYSEWQPMAQHMYSKCSFVPGVGYVEAGNIPTNGTFTPELNTGSAVVGYPEYNTLSFGTASHGMNSPGSSVVTGVGLRGWKRDGANAGKWQTLAVVNITGAQTIANVADWNPTTGKLLFTTSESDGRSNIFEWQSGSAAIHARTVGGAAISGNSAGSIAFGNLFTAMYWLTGNTYLFLRQQDGALANYNAVLTYNHSTGSSQQLTASGYLATALNNRHTVCLHVDHVHSKIWWVLGQSSGAVVATKPRLFYSPISDPMNLKELRYRDVSTPSMVRGLGDLSPKTFFAYDGYLWFRTTAGSMPGTPWGASGVYRIPIF